MTDVLTSKIVKHDQFYSRVIEMIPGELYKHTVSEDADGAQEAKYAMKRKLPLTNDERKTISKAKKAEKYSTAASATPVAVVETEAVPAEETTAETAAPAVEGDLEGLRERLQVQISTDCVKQRLGK